MGSILGTVVADHLKTGIAGLEPEQQLEAAKTLGSGAIPQISELPGFLRIVVESAYGMGVGSVFLAALPLAIVTLIAVIFLPNARLGTQNAIQLAEAEKTRELEDAEDAAIDSASAAVALAPVGLAHDPATGSVEVVAAASAGRRTDSRAE
jgi:hypothetical protein